MASERYTPRRTSLRTVARALRELEPGDPLHSTLHLRKRLPVEEARFAAEVLDARARARGRLPIADVGFFTKKGVAQASREPVARARARRIRERMPSATVLDATCGVGGDSLALAAEGLALVSADRDPLHALLTSENLRAAGLADRVVVADATRPAVRADVLVLDPDRRAEGERRLDPDAWAPTLDEALRLAAEHDGACLKLPPSFDPRELADRLPGGLEHRLQWVSCERELCEVALWTGRLAGGDSEVGEHEVLALETRGGPPESRISGHPESLVSLTPEEVSRILWLAEPDPAVIRSGLIGRLGRELGLRPVGPGIAFLGGEREPPAGLLRRWRVLGVERADPRRVRALLQRHDVGPVTVIKRGHPDRPEVLERRFRGAGSRRGLLAVARLERGHAVFLLDAGGPMVGDEGFEPPTSSL